MSKKMYNFVSFNLFIKKIMRIFVLYIFLLCCSVVCGQPVEPILMLNSGFHTASIRNICTDASGRYMITASEDKTARLLEARTGDVLRVFRPPVGYGNEGSLYACALSPDGAIAAVSGCTGGSWNKADSTKITLGSWTGFAWQLKYSIYLFSTATGELLRNIDHLESEIYDLQFSPNGEYLAAALGESKGIRIFKASDGAELHKLMGHGGTVRKIAFSKSGQMTSVADDQSVRLYTASFQPVVSQSLTGKPSCVVFSPDETTIAIGFSDKSPISLHQLNELKKNNKSTLLASPNKYNTAVAYSPDGTLYAGGYTQDGKNSIAVWKNGMRTADIVAGTGKTTDIRALPDGSVVFSTSYPEIGRILSDHKPPAKWEENKEQAYLRTADMITLAQRQLELFQVNDNATEVGLTGAGVDVLFFSLPERELTVAPSHLPKSTRQNLEKNIIITGWKDSPGFSLNGKALPIFDKDEINRCVDISKSGKYILLGTNQHIICLDGQGKVIWKQILIEECIAVKIAGNEKVFVAALADGTYAWYDMTVGTQLLTLFVHPDHKRWILWTPDRFYDCSIGAEDLIGWNLNQGKDKASSFFPAAQFRNNYYRPEMIDWSVSATGSKQALAQKSGINAGDDKQNMAQMLPPVINIISPRPGSSANSRQVKMQYSVETQNNRSVESVKVLVDGRPVQLLPSVPTGTHEVTIEIPERDCDISMIAKNGYGTSVPANIRMKWTGNQNEIVFKPKLYVLAVGISKYKDKDLALQFAAKDANDFANIMLKQKGFLYSDVSIKLLTDDKSNKSNILDGLEWIQNETTSRDVAMIFFAGHGMNDNTENFYYLPVEADRDRLRSTCINYVEIKQTVAAIAGKVVLFMDACHSGGVMGSTRRGAADINGLVNELSSADNGAVVFTSSTGKQYSLEDDSWNNGAFTKALVEGIKGDADIFKQGSITIKTLDLFISQRVKELTKGKQAPTTIIPGSISDFPVAVTR